MSIVLWTAAAVFAPMLLEARLSARHERALRAQGATDPAADVYPVMQAAYPGLFVLMLVEGVIRDPRPGLVSLSGVSLFAAAKLLKYWAIASLGERWTFRVLVPPGSHPTAGGPYRWLRHPNYLAVLCELGGAALVVHAFITGVIALLGFGGLIAARIRVEERALGIRPR